MRVSAVSNYNSTKNYIGKKNSNIKPYYQNHMVSQPSPAFKGKFSKLFTIGLLTATMGPMAGIGTAVVWGLIDLRNDEDDGTGIAKDKDKDKDK